jgi:very-short-patch-repair endonuclease
MAHKSQTQQGLAKLATHQCGVVTNRQLWGLGYTKERISLEVAVGRLHRVHRGVYAVGHTALSRPARCLAAVLAGGAGAVLSYRSAAWLWGLTDRWTVPIEITASGPRAHRSDMRVHSAKTLAPEDRQSAKGIPTTSVARTLLDFAAVDPGYLSVALDRCERRGILDLIEIDSLIARSRGFRGVARLREALEIHRTPAFTRSGLERRFLALVRRAGLPRPAMNIFVEGYELDAYWDDVRFAVELDTYDYHGSHSAFENDRLRQEDLKLAGIEMTRITGTRIAREPAAVIQRLRRLLEQRRLRRW